MMTGFVREEDGVALTEYVVLLGVLVGGVIVAVAFFGDSFADAFRFWGTWVQNSFS